MDKKKRKFNPDVCHEIVIVDAFNVAFRDRRIREQNGHLTEALHSLGERIISSSAYGDFLVEIAADSSNVTETERKKHGSFFLVFCPNGGSRTGADGYLLDALKRARYFKNMVLVTDDSEARMNILRFINKKRLSNCTLLSVREFFDEINGRNKQLD
ncbi:MAG: hypothetical protein V2B12_01760 [bacterium]